MSMQCNVYIQMPWKMNIGPDKGVNVTFQFRLFVLKLQQGTHAQTTVNWDVGLAVLLERTMVADITAHPHCGIVPSSLVALGHYGIFTADLNRSSQCLSYCPIPSIHGKDISCWMYWGPHSTTRPHISRTAP